MNFNSTRLLGIASKHREHFWYAPRLRLLSEIVTRHFAACNRRPFLDVGCGNGSILAELKAKGVPAMGVEPCTIDFDFSISDVIAADILATPGGDGDWPRVVQSTAASSVAMAR